MIESDPNQRGSSVDEKKEKENKNMKFNPTYLHQTVKLMNSMDKHATSCSIGYTGKCFIGEKIVWKISINLC